ncbi:MAG: hypothetical protein JNJ41_02445 [Bacteroidia bacterium]|nr:hypothetical protein [Bacteroidia bacterium]
MAKEKLHIAIDTNWLRRDLTFSKPDMLQLKELSKLHLIKLHFPWFIYKECTSNNIDAINIAINGSITKISYLDYKGLHKDDHESFKKIADEMELLKTKVQASVEKVWAEFIAETDSNLYQFEPSDSKIVFENYFEGNSPFSSLKSRKDIPDAFIFESLKKISKKFKIHFVVEDGNLYNKCKEEKIIVHKNFDDLYSTEEFKAALNLQEELNKSSALMPQLLEGLEEIKEAIEVHFYDGFKTKHIVDRHLPSDNFEGEVTGIENIISIQMLDNKIKFIDGSYYLPAIVMAECFVDYNIYKSDYYALDESRNIFTSELNDYYFEAQERLPITFEFNVIIPKEMVEEEDYYDLEIKDYENVYVGVQDCVEVYSLDRKKIELVAEKEKKVVIFKKIDLHDKVFRIQYPKSKDKKHIHLRFDLFNINGKKISKTIFLDNHRGLTEFRMDIVDAAFDEDFEFSTMGVVSDSDVTITLSIFHLSFTNHIF